MTDSPEDILLRGVVRVENVENPAQYIPAVLARCKPHHLERTYDVKGWANADSNFKFAEDDGNMVGRPLQSKIEIEQATRFLDALARKGGRLMKGGEADLDGVAKMVLNDFLRGKIPWFVPPVAEGVTAIGVEEGEGRDEALGITHGKRKREEEEENAKEGAATDIAAGEEDGFEGFDDEDGEGGSESDGEDGVVGGVELAAEESDSDEESS